MLASELNFECINGIVQCLLEAGNLRKGCHLEGAGWNTPWRPSIYPSEGLKHKLAKQVPSTRLASRFSVFLEFFFFLALSRGPVPALVVQNSQG